MIPIKKLLEVAREAEQAVLDQIEQRIDADLATAVSDGRTEAYIIVEDYGLGVLARLPEVLEKYAKAGYIVRPRKEAKDNVLISIPKQ